MLYIMSVQLTKQAIKHIKSLLNPQGQYLKFGVKSGGCNGFEYTVDFTDKIDKFDHIVQDNDIKIAIDSISFMYVKNLIIDYENTLLYSGFKFKNPNATGSCGCNKSFSI